MKGVTESRLATGLIRLAIVVMAGTAIFVSWGQAGAPYAELQNRIFALDFGATTQWTGDFGTPVYYGPKDQPQELHVDISQMGLLATAEPKIKNDETVNCLRQFPNPLVRVVDRPLPSLAEILSANRPANPLPTNFILFSNESTARAVVTTTSPPTLDFGAIHPDARLDACLFRAQMKVMNQAKSDISDAKKEFYLSSAWLLAKPLFGELALFLMVYWVLRGFFGASGSAS